MRELTDDVLLSILEYDGTTGAFKWKPREISMCADKRSCATWNTRFSGKSAFTTSRNDGYLMGWIFGKGYLAHRVAWVMTYGYWPDAEVDHINMDKRDNRISNLREASRSENQHNRKAYKTNTSGFKGVSFHKQSGMWQSSISLEGVKKYLGLFATAELAHKEYSIAAKKMHGEFKRTS